MTGEKQLSPTLDQEEALWRVICSRNAYETLGLQPGSPYSTKELMSAYKQAALLLHPDKNPSPLAEKAFTSVSDALQTLKDPKKRALHDKQLQHKLRFQNDQVLFGKIPRFAFVSIFVYDVCALTVCLLIKIFGRR